VNQETSLMLSDQEDHLALWAHQENRDHVDREAIRGRRDPPALAAETASQVPPEILDPLDLQVRMDPLALVETLLLRWQVDSTRRREVPRWV